MNKTIVGLMMAMVLTNAGAYTICGKTNTFVGAVRKNVNGTVVDVTNTATKKQWAVAYDYKTITGYAACNEISGTVGSPKTNLYTTAQDAGQYCWCEMWPIYDDDDTTNYHYETGMSSWWVLLSTYSNSSDCASGCTSACANAMANNTNSFRSAVFEAVW